MVDYYDTLGVSHTATLGEIKTAYRKLSKKFHPDVNNADPFFERMFMRIQTAYEVLSDNEQRKRYDAQRYQKVSSNNYVRQSTTQIPKVINFSVNKSEIKRGEVFTITWKVENADVVEIKPFGKFASEGVESFKFNHINYPSINLILIASNAKTAASVRDVLTMQNISFNNNFLRTMWRENGGGILLIKIIIVITILIFMIALFIVGVEVRDPLEGLARPE